MSNFINVAQGMVECVTNWANDAMFNINLHMKFD